MAYEVPPFVIEVLSDTASQSITLTGRSLPYQQVSWGVKQRTKQTWYPGNPVATMQVLGPMDEPTTIRGTWKDRFLQQQVDIVGFPGINGAKLTAEQLVACFRQILRAGNDLKVQWGPNVRYGILTDFQPTWTRPQDIEWTMEFTWVGEELSSPKANITAEQSTELQTAQQNFDDTWIQDPTYVSPDYRAGLAVNVNDMRRAVGVVFDGIRAAQTAPLLPLYAVQSVLSAAVTTQLYAESLVRSFSDLPYTYAQTSDSVIDVLRTESWRRSTARETSILRSQAIRQALLYTKTARPGSIAVITLPQDTSLRQLSQTYYGTADQWQNIADANGFDRSVVPQGTIVIIPPAPAPVI